MYLYIIIKLDIHKNTTFENKLGIQCQVCPQISEKSQPIINWVDVLKLNNYNNNLVKPLQILLGLYWVAKFIRTSSW